MKKQFLLTAFLFCVVHSFAQYHNVYQARLQWSWLKDFYQQDDVISNYNGMALDDSDNIYFTGSALRGALSDPGWMVGRLSPAGSPTWIDGGFASSGASGSAYLSVASAIVYDSAYHGVYNCGNYLETQGGYGAEEVIAIAAFQGGTNPNPLNLPTFGNYFLPDDPSDASTWVHNANALNGAVDKKGNLYVTGYISQENEKQICLVTMRISQYKPWSSPYKIGKYLSGQGQFVSYDSQGNVYVSGTRTDTITDSTSNTSLLCLKYDSSGNVLWDKIYYNKDLNNITNATGIAVDNSGNVYMSGYYPTANGKQDAVVIKYTKNGQTDWVKKYSGYLLKTQSTQINGICLDRAGNLYSEGYIETDSGRFATLIKYDTAGKALWVDTLIDPANGRLISEAFALTLDDTGNVYVTGTREDGITYRNIFTARYNASGARQWYIRYNDSAMSKNEPVDIKVDKKGNVVVAAIHEGDTLTGKDVLILKYNQLMFKVKDTSTHTSSVEGALASESWIKVYPNPFNSKLNCVINLQNSALVDIKIIDIVGNSVMVSGQVKMAAGKQNIEMDVNNLAPGVYFFQCALDGLPFKSGKIVKQ